MGGRAVLRLLGNVNLEGEKMEIPALWQNKIWANKILKLKIQVHGRF